MCWRWRATTRRCIPVGRKAWSGWRHGSWPSRYRIRTGSSLSAGEGGKQALRLYDWARVSLLHWTQLKKWHWLLVRRSITDRADLTYYACFSRNDVPLAELVRVAGHGWISEDALQEARQEVGLDQYEARQWTSWYRHITLALLAHALLAVTRYYAIVGDAKGVSISEVGTVEKVGPVAVVSSESGSETGYQPA